ncbi:MAG: hypothetical protein Harvfovirus1_87 [Harvfovirus sp.]|uniref:Uncharacterized protein n=1 Tax=Harvfovirus sp. TaxID=2487768 RepID=A0A3G4ZZZ2_9VIRU|nr:MAG: hypothetical protein Harvfovirus1_87 [Harvfovirus sp.]
MTQFKLEGFRICGDRYVFPIYSHTCDCNIKKYLRIDSYELLRRQYYKKYIELRKEKVSMTSYIAGMFRRNPVAENCENHPRLEKNRLTCENYNEIEHAYFDNIHLRKQLDKAEEFYKSLEISPNFDIWSWLGSVAANYWVACQYDWFSLTKKYNLSPQEKEVCIAEAYETRLLARIDSTMEKFRVEICCGLKTSNIILPLINIICDYADSPLFAVGKIIKQFKNDIVEYSKL